MRPYLPRALSNLARPSSQHSTQRLPPAGGVCKLVAGVHLVSEPIAVPSNIEVAGDGSGLTTVRSLMANPAVITGVCNGPGGNCAVFTVNNISRENITIRDLTVDGGLTPEFKAYAATHCGSQTGASDPCPPCKKVGYQACKWNNFGILIWDYNKGGKPRNIRLSGLVVENCSMGLHVLGTTNITVSGSSFLHNGNGNAFFHNAYFLRVRDTIVTDCTFSNATGHGLKITSQNNTLVENTLIQGNRWQGIWVGDEMGHDNYGLVLRNLTVEENGMYGIQLASTHGFLVEGCTIRYNPGGAANAGLGIKYSTDGVVSSSALDRNGINILVDHAKNVTFRNVACGHSFENNAFCADTLSRSAFTVSNSTCTPELLETCSLV